MLRWAGGIEHGGGTMRYAIGLAPGIRMFSVTRSGMIYDSSYDVAHEGLAKENLTLYAILSGDLWLRDPDEHIASPALLLMPQQIVDGTGGRRSRHLLNVGAPVRVFQVAFATSAWRGRPHSGKPGDVQRVDVDRAVLDALAEASAEFQDDDPVASRDAAIELCEILINARLLASDTHPLRSTGWGTGVDRMWNAFSAVISQSALPSLTELGDAASKSPRQLQRDLLQLASTMALSSNIRWRTTMLQWRIKLAMALLSAPDTTPAQVARALGYGSAEALARAFAQTGFERPALVREALRAISLAPPGVPRATAR